MTSREASFRVLLLLSVASAAMFAGELPGVGNFHRVNEHIYRGAQPTSAGFANLARLGIATVIDLRGFDNRSKDEERVVRSAGMRYINVPLKGLGAPSPEDVVKILHVLNDPAAAPVFIHCRRGADRTGTVLACYRISHDGWENRKALAEARSLGMRWFERAMQNFVLTFKASSLEKAEVATATGR